LQVDIASQARDYFRTNGIPLRKGRFFTEDDNADKPQVVIIDEKFAAALLADSDPSENTCGSTQEAMTIVGVVGVVKQYGLETDGKIATYFPQQQQPDPRMFLVVRTSSEAAGLSSTVVAKSMRRIRRWWFTEPDDAGTVA